MKRWPIQPLGEIAELYQPKTITSADILSVGPYKVFGANGVIGFYNKYNHEEAEVAVTCRGATCGTVNFTEPKCWITGNAMVVAPKDNRLDKRYLFYALKGSNMTSVISGSAQPQITRQSFAPMEIPVPPLEDQERIVRLLDEAEDLRKLRAQSDHRATALIPALFHGIFDNSDSRNWKEHSLGDSEILEIIDGDRGANYPKKFEFREEGYCLFLNTSNVRKGSFDFSKCDFITREKDNSLRKGKLMRDDVILTTRGTLGNSAYYDRSLKYENLRINSGMVILRPNTSILLPEYLLIILNSKEFTNQVITMTSGSAQPQLPINRLTHVKFVLPPLPLQTEFVKQLTEIRELESSQATSRTRLDALFQSMLHRAFNAEL